MRVLDLFSGIGGFSLGLERAGPFWTVAFCEREPFCQAVLRKHWPATPIYEDVRTIPTGGLGRIDLICGGFPCQPWSVAGQRAGAEDDRDLWPEMARLVAELQPTYVIGENVRGFINEPMGLQRSLSDLESLGYQAVPFIIPACAVDAPHRRDRVWIVAHAEGDRREHQQNSGGSSEGIGAGEEYRSGNGGEALAVAASARLEGAKRSKFEKSRKRLTERGKDVAHADSERPQGVRPNSYTEGRQEPSERPLGLCNGTTTARGWLAEPDVGGMADGFPRWLVEPDCGRVATGVKNRVPRLKALGNAVVPQVVEQIGRAILAAEEGE